MGVSRSSSPSPFQFTNPASLSGPQIAGQSTRNSPTVDDVHNEKTIDVRNVAARSRANSLRGVAIPSSTHANQGTLSNDIYRLVDEDVQAYISAINSATTTKDHVNYYKANDIISQYKAAPNGNTRLMAESIAMINASQAPEMPKIYFAYDAYNVFKKIELLQKELQEKLLLDPGSNEKKVSVRFVFKPNESAFNHSIMCECDIHPDKVIVVAIDTYIDHAIGDAVPTEIKDILEETAEQFRNLNMKIGVFFNGSQKGKGCFQYALANAEFIPPDTLTDAKKVVEDNTDPCVSVMDREGKILPLESYLFTSSPTKILFSQERFVEATDTKQRISSYQKEHKSTTRFGSTYVNSIVFYRLSTLKKLRQFFKKMKKEDPRGEVFSKMLKEAVACPDISWRRPLEKALAQFAWTPEMEISILNKLVANKASKEEESRMEIAMNFMEALPFLQSSRLRSMVTKMWETDIANLTSNASKVLMLEHANKTFSDNANLIKLKQFEFFTKMHEKHWPKDMPPLDITWSYPFSTLANLKE